MGRSRPPGRRNKRNYLRSPRPVTTVKRHGLQPPVRPLFEPAVDLELSPGWQELIGICTPPFVTPPGQLPGPSTPPSPPSPVPRDATPEYDGIAPRYTGPVPLFPPFVLDAPPPAYSRPARTPVFIRATDPRLQRVDKHQVPYKIVGQPQLAHVQWLFGETPAPASETPAAARTSARDPRLHQ